MARRQLGDDVEIIEGDLTVPATLVEAPRNVSHIIVTAGVRSGRFAREPVVRATEYEGILSTIAAAQAQGFTGRFVYMTSIGVTQASVFGTALNLWKGNTLVWRRRAEEAIRSSGMDYTVVRSAFLLNRRAGRHEICVTQKDRPLNLRELMSRADLAEVLIQAAFQLQASRSTIEVSWCGGPRRTAWDQLFRSLRPD